MAGTKEGGVSKAVVFLNLYHVERTDHDDHFGDKWDCSLDFVICCEDEETAKRTHPNGIYEWWTKEGYFARHSDWVNPDRLNDHLKVTLIGSAAEGIKKGPICVSSCSSG